MNRKSQKLAARTAPSDKVSEDNDLVLDKRESDIDNVVDFGVSDVVGEGNSTEIQSLFHLLARTLVLPQKLFWTWSWRLLQFQRLMLPICLRICLLFLDNSSIAL